METPFADSRSTNERAEEKIQLSSAIADQILDKEAFAAGAQEHFVDWDKDKSRSLSLTELSDVYDSTTASYEERATASILSQNFSRLSNLCAPQLDDDPNRNSYTKPGYWFLESQFGSDAITHGITPKDLNVLSMLVSERGQQEFVQNAETAEKQDLGLNGLFTGLNGTLAVVTLARLLAPGPIRAITAAAFGVNSVATVMSGTALFDATRKNDLQLMEMQFKSRKAMLDSLDVPRP